MIAWKEQTDGLYNGPPLTTFDEFDNLVTAVDLFFVTCEHLNDWLHQDTTIPLITKKVVREYSKKSQALQIAHAYANTWKHHTRTSGRSAWVLKDEDADTRPTATIECTDPFERSDAAELAQRCIDAWQKFLSDHNLKND